MLSVHYFNQNPNISEGERDVEISSSVDMLMDVRISKCALVRKIVIFVTIVVKQFCHSLVHIY